MIRLAENVTGLRANKTERSRLEILLDQKIMRLAKPRRHAAVIVLAAHRQAAAARNLANFLFAHGLCFPFGRVQLSGL